MMCANKYENRQNDEYECCTPFHPYLSVCKQKKSWFFVQLQKSLCKILIESVHFFDWKQIKMFSFEKEN